MNEDSSKNLTSVLVALVLFSAVIRVPMLPQQGRTWFAVFFEVSTALAFAAVMWRENKYWALFFSAAVVSMFFPAYGPFGYYAYVSILHGCLWYYMAVKYLRDREKFYNILCIIAAINLIFASAQALDIPCAIYSFVPVGLMANPLELAALMAFCLPAFFRKGWVYGIWIPILGAAIAGPILGIISGTVGAVFYLVLSFQAYGSLLLFLLPIPYFMFIDQPGFQERIQPWAIIWQEYTERWLWTGAGIGHFKLAFHQTQMPPHNLRWEYAHNEFLQGIFEMGVAFVLIVTGYFVNIIRRLKNVKDLRPLTALVIITIECCAEFVLHIGPLAIIAITWVALLEQDLRGKTLWAE